MKRFFLVVVVVFVLMFVFVVGYVEEVLIMSGVYILMECQQFVVINVIFEDCLQNLFFGFMCEVGIDMWFVFNCEYNEDFVYFSLVFVLIYVVCCMMMFVFYDCGEEEGVDLFMVNCYLLGVFYELVWEGGDFEEQWCGFGDLIVV